MKTKTVKTKVLEYTNTITILVSNYKNNNNLYIGLYDNTEDEYYKDITTNILPLSGCFGYVNSSDTEILQFIEEQHIGISKGIQTRSGFNTYIMYQFTIDNSFTDQEGL